MDKRHIITHKNIVSISGISDYIVTDADRPTEISWETKGQFSNSSSAYITIYLKNKLREEDAIRDWANTDHLLTRKLYNSGMMSIKGFNTIYQFIYRTMNIRCSDNLGIVCKNCRVYDISDIERTGKVVIYTQMAQYNYY